MRHSNSLMKPNELPKCNENNRYEFQSEKFAHKFSLVDESVRPTSQEMRTAQYEKSLTKGYWPPKTITKMDHSNDMAKKMVEKCQRSAVLKKDIIQMIESGLQLSEYQSRTAFSVYLQCILQSLSDFNEERGSEVGQTEEVLKFLQKAALSLREPYYLKAPSNKLSGKDRAAVVAKELHEFLSHYKRETELYALFIDEPKMIARHQFEEFIANAIDSDLEDVLILQTKRYHCAHIFLGKCLPPAIGQKNCLFRTAYGISPDRNLRDRLCSIRMNARSNY